MTKEVFTQLNNILIEYCSESIHDMLHVYRVLSFALDIAQNEKEIVDMDILITATLLHDIAREEERLDPSVCHAKRGAELSEKILGTNLSCSRMHPNTSFPRDGATRKY